MQLKLNKRFDDFCILTSTEVDILSDGSIDYPDEILKELDIVVAAIHSGFKQEPEKLEQRIISAMKNPFIHIIAHPTGKLYGERDPFPIDMEKILTTAKETHTAMELNANYLRLDLDDVALKRAKELGVKIALSTDAHTEDQLWMMDLGVATARRGWLAKEDVLNTMELPEILRFCMEKERSLSKQIDYKKDKR